MSGSEVAFFSLSTKDINVLKTRQQPSFRRVVNLMERPKTLLASMQITNALVNLGLIICVNTLVDELLINQHSGFWIRFTIKFGSLIFLIVLLAEVLPKVWATHHKIRFAAASSLTVEIFNSLFYTLSKRMVRFSERIEKKKQSDSSGYTDNDNLDLAIDLLPEHEASVEEKLILKGIRKFGDTMVKQVMRTRLDVSGIELQTSFSELLKKVEELHYSRLPVYRSNLDDIAGMLHTKDLLAHFNEAPDFNWHDLIRLPHFVHEQKLIEDLLQEFRTRRIHFAIVVDEFGGTSGIITLEDIMEEIIGEIKDEFDDEESANKKIDDHNYIFEGKTMINDVCKAMGIGVDSFDEIRGDSDSLAGLVLEIAGEFPEVNSTLVHGAYTFVPLEINKNRIDKVKLTIEKPVNASKK
jgi:gliding motility-associated protein GldE